MLVRAAREHARHDMRRSPAGDGGEVERKEPGRRHAERARGHRHEGTHRGQKARQEHGRISALREERFAPCDHLGIAAERPEPARPVGMTAAERVGRAVAQRRPTHGRSQHAGKAEIAGADQCAQTHDHGGARHERAHDRHGFEERCEKQHGVSPLRVCGDGVDQFVDGFAPQLSNPGTVWRPEVTGWRGPPEEISFADWALIKAIGGAPARMNGFCNADQACAELL